MKQDRKTERVLPGGLLGYLDDFESEAGADDVLFLRGWVLGNGSHIQSVILKRRAGEPIPIPYGLPRPDVAEAYPDDPRAAKAGFAAQVTIQSPANRGVLHRIPRERIDICALLDNGRLVRCFSRTFPPRKVTQTDFTHKPFAALVATVIRRAIVAYGDGRLSFSPRKWLNELQLQYRQIILEGAGTAHPQALEVAVRQTMASLDAVRLRTFLDSSRRLSWPSDPAPRLAIILALSDAEHAFTCLSSIVSTSLPIEMVIVDNGSGDTSRLLDRLDGVRILRPEKTLDLVSAWNLAARMATADHLLFLKPGVELLPGAVESAVRTLEFGEAIGAVGAKVVLPDGRLEDAGGIIWSDGSYGGYGRHDTPQSYAYMYARDVDCCSSVFLLTRRKTFAGMNGFIDDYRSITEAQMDYCIRLWKSGKRVVFDPSAVVVNFRFSSDGVPTKLFTERHAQWLADKFQPGDVQLLHARVASRTGKNIFVLDDRVPHFHHGAGFPRAVELIRTLDKSGNFVTFYPVTMPHEEWDEVYEDIPRTVEVIIGWGEARLHQFLEERDGYYDAIIVSRPHNMKTFRALFRRDGRWTVKSRVIYDAEAIFSAREAEQRRMSGEQVTDSDLKGLLAEEMSLADGVDAVFSVTDQERNCFVLSGVRTVWTLGHVVNVQPTRSSFSERAGFVFVGAMGGIPNRDAVLWFSKDILPKVHGILGQHIRFSVVGGNAPEELRAISGVDVLGQIADLNPIYNHSRVFVAPSRLAAGIPIKVQTAAAHGLPVVCTPILAEELGWKDGDELLVARDADDFAKCCARLYSDEGLWQRLRRNALDRVARECSPEAFAAVLAKALE